MSEQETVTGEVVDKVEVEELPVHRTRTAFLSPRVYTHHFTQGGTYKLVRVEE